MEGFFLSFLLFLSMYMIPFVLLYVVGYAFLKKRDAYGDFVRGAGEGIHTAFAILPTLVGLMTAVGILRASGFLKWLSDILGRHFCRNRISGAACAACSGASVFRQCGDRISSG